MELPHRAARQRPDRVGGPALIGVVEIVHGQSLHEDRSQDRLDSLVEIAPVCLEGALLAGPGGHVGEPVLQNIANSQALALTGKMPGGPVRGE